MAKPGIWTGSAAIPAADSLPFWTSGAAAVDIITHGGERADVVIHKGIALCHFPGLKDFLDACIHSFEKFIHLMLDEHAMVRHTITAFLCILMIIL